MAKSKASVFPTQSRAGLNDECHGVNFVSNEFIITVINIATPLSHVQLGSVVSVAGHTVIVATCSLSPPMSSSSARGQTCAFAGSSNVLSPIVKKSELRLAYWTAESKKLRGRIGDRVCGTTVLAIKRVYKKIVFQVIDPTMRTHIQYKDSGVPVARRMTVLLVDSAGRGVYDRHRYRATVLDGLADTPFPICMIFSVIGLRGSRLAVLVGILRCYVCKPHTQAVREARRFSDLDGINKDKCQCQLTVLDERNFGKPKRS
jgi:hypothetical protein